MKARSTFVACLTLYGVYHATLKTIELRQNRPTALGQALSLLATSHTSGLSVGHTLAMKLKDSRGHTTTVQELAVQAPFTVFAFFESWCGPCKRELPHLQRMMSQFAANHIQWIGIWSDSDQGEVAMVLHTLGVTFPMFQDVGHQGRAMGIDAVPTTVVVDTEGKIIRHTRGEDNGLAAFLSDSIHNPHQGAHE
jgi:peroxiredoxin